MKYQIATVALLAAAIAAAPLSPANAGWHHDRRGYVGFGLFAAGAAVVGAAVAVATLPFRAIAESAEPAPAYYAPQAYAAPAYTYAPVYQPSQVVVYRPAPVYGYPAYYSYR